MELNFTPETLKKWAGIVVLLVLVGLGVYALISVLPDSFFKRAPDVTDVSDDVQPGAEAAKAGIEAVFTLDYEESEEAWLERVCSVSTAVGCDMTERLFASSITTLKTDAEAKTGSAAEVLRMVDSGDETDGVGDDETVIYSWEIWEVAVTLDNPWSGAENMNNLFIKVTNEEGEWKFARILFDEEVERYAEESNDVQ